MKNLQKAFVVLALMTALLLPLTACNTVEGLGQDAKAAGEAITGAASKSKGY